jgi:enoyl-CoA hydratase/carnithine racemase
MSDTSRRQFIQGTGVLAGDVLTQTLTGSQAPPAPAARADRHALFDEYSKRYQTVRMRREDGIIELQFHTDGGSLQWGGLPHSEFGSAFLDVGRDRENQVVILTGTGRDWSGPAVPPGGAPQAQGTSADNWDRTYWEGKHLLMNLLDIEVPVISAINGPVARHAEIPLVSDIVLAADSTTFQDTAHFSGGLVPGDGVHIVFPLLMGLNRGRYFLLTGQTLSATEAKDVGLVSEVLPQAQVLSRQLMQRPPLRRRYARVLLTQDLKRRMHELLGYGLALEGLAATQGSNQAPSR